MIFFLYIKILNINFNYFTMDKNIKDYITDMYNFLYDLHIDDPGTCMTGNELLSKMVSSHNTPYQNLWYRNLTPAHSVLDIRDQMSTGGLNMTVKEE